MGKKSKKFKDLKQAHHGEGQSEEPAVTRTADWADRCVRRPAVSTKLQTINFGEARNSELTGNMFNTINEYFLQASSP